MSVGAKTAKQVSPFIRGVSITTFDENDIGITAYNDGYIPEPELYSTQQVFIYVDIDPWCNAWGFYADRKGNITPAENNSVYAEMKCYEKKVPIHKNKEPYTLYNENHTKLLEIIFGNNLAILTIYEIAVVFQNGLGFLTTQRVYEEFLYQNKFRITCPGFDDKWPQLVEFVNESYGSNSISLFPEIDEAPASLPVSAENLSNGVGKVKWFNVAQGFGAIFMNKGEAFVHYKDISFVSQRRLICPTVGEEVLFGRLIPNYSDDGFPYKAVGVIAA